MVVIPNGVYSADFPSRAERSGKVHFPQLDPARRWLLFFGRIAAVKGLDLLLEAWRDLADLHHEWQLVIVGPNFEGYRPKLDALIAPLSREAAPVILESMIGEAKLQMLNASDLFVLTSRAEGLPVAILEALVCHLPVVVTTACNFSQRTLGDAGWVCPPTVTGVSEALQAALTSPPEELRRRGELARALALASYDWKPIAQSILACSESLVA